MLRKNFTEIANYVYSEGEYAKKNTVTGLDIKRTRIDKYTGFRRTCEKRGLRTKQFTKLKGIYGKWYHKTPFSQEDKKKYLRETLVCIGYYISFSNRDVTDYGSNVIPYIPANILRRMAFYDKGLVNLKNMHCIYSAPYTDSLRDYTSAKTYKVHVYKKVENAEDLMIRLIHCKRNADIWVHEF